MPRTDQSLRVQGFKSGMLITDITGRAEISRVCEVLYDRIRFEVNEGEPRVREVPGYFLQLGVGQKEPIIMLAFSIQEFTLWLQEGGF